MNADQKYELAYEAQRFKMVRLVWVVSYLTIIIALVLNYWQQMEKLKVEAAKAGLPAPSSVPGILWAFAIGIITSAIGSEVHHAWRSRRASKRVVGNEQEH